jgi:hypothetical protein
MKEKFSSNKVINLIELNIICFFSSPKNSFSLLLESTIAEVNKEPFRENRITFQVVIDIYLSISKYLNNLKRLPSEISVGICSKL